MTLDDPRTSPGPRPPRALPRLRHRPDVQGIRGLAVLLVVLDHAGVPGLAGGYVGVDVFLVLSGYLISSLLLHEVTATGRLSLVAFYAGRARRILPAATLVLVATTVAATLLLSYVRAADVVTDVVWAAFFAANIHAGLQSTDYFASDLPPSPVQHFWSLAVEEQFYLVWPAVLVVVLVLLARRRTAVDHERLRRVRARLPALAAVVVLASGASLWWSVTSTATSASGAYFSTPARVWELGVGVLLALAGHRVEAVGPRVSAVLRLVGLGLLAWAVLGFDATTGFPGAAALVPVLGTAALLVAGAGGHHPPIAGLLTARWLRSVGDVSYSFYLWHWPFLVIAAGCVGHPLGLGWNLLLLLAAYATAVGTYHLVENPVRRARPLLRRPRSTLVLWPVALGVVLGAGGWSSAYVASEQTQQAAASAQVDLAALPASQRVPRTGTELHRQVARSLDLASLGAPVPYPVTPPLEDVFADTWVRDERCTAQPEQSSSDLCPIVGSASSGAAQDPTVVVLGDSHANMWLPGLAADLEDTATTLVPIVKFGCTPFPLTPLTDGGERLYDECLDWQDWAVAQVDALAPDVVVVGSSVHATLASADGSPVVDRAERRAAWRAASRELAAELAGSAGRVVLLGDTVAAAVRSGDCLASRDATMASCNPPVEPATVRLNRDVAAGAAEGGADYVDPNPLLCAESRCPAVVDDVVVYRSSHHVTRAYAERAGPTLVRMAGLDDLGGRTD